MNERVRGGKAGDPELTAELAASATRQTTSDAESGTLAMGSTVGDYVIEAVIAAGGFGSVYEARHMVIGRRVAIKVLHPTMCDSPKAIERFLREAQAANAIRHPAIVDIFDFGRTPEGRPYLVMTLIDGVGVDVYVGEHGPLTVAEAIELFEPLCSALDAAHAVNIIHRDLKPSNVLIHRSASKGRGVTLIDFGIAKLIAMDRGDTGFTSVGRRLGTPVSISPEQLRGELVDGRADVYALGVLLHFALSGNYPFHAPTPAELEALHLTAPPPRLSARVAVPPGVDDVVLRALSKDRDHRPASAGQLLEALRSAIAQGGAPRAAKGVGIFVEMRVRDDQLDEVDDALLDAMDAFLAWTSERAAARGYTCPLRSSGSLLAICVLPENPDSKDAALADATAFGEELALGVAERQRTEPRLLAHVTLHVDTVLLRTGRNDVAGGPLLSVSAWAARAGSSTLTISDSVTRTRPTAR